MRALTRAASVQPAHKAHGEDREEEHQRKADEIRRNIGQYPAIGLVDRNIPRDRADDEDIKPDHYAESLDFFTRVYGLTLSGEDGRSAYLPIFDDCEFHSLKLTRHHTTGVGHIAYRALSPEALMACLIAGRPEENPWRGRWLRHIPVE